MSKTATAAPEPDDKKPKPASKDAFLKKRPEDDFYDVPLRIDGEETFVRARKIHKFSELEKLVRESDQMVAWCKSGAPPFHQKNDWTDAQVRYSYLFSRMVVEPKMELMEVLQAMENTGQAVSGVVEFMMSRNGLDADAIRNGEAAMRQNSFLVDGVVADDQVS